MHERNGRGAGGFRVVGWDAVTDAVREGADALFRVRVAGGGGGGNDGGLVALVGAGGEAVLEGIHVWGHHGDAAEHDAEPEGDGEGDEMQPSSAHETVVEGGDKVLLDKILVGEKSGPLVSLVAA